MEFGEKRLGNWIVTKYEKDGVPFIKVSPVSGEYSWEYSALDEMYLSIDGHIDDEFSHDGLQTCLGIMGGFLHAQDPVFYDLYVRCMEVYASIAEVRKPTTREQELKIINEMKVEYEFQQELDKLKEADNG